MVKKIRDLIKQNPDLVVSDMLSLDGKWAESIAKAIERRTKNYHAELVRRIKEATKGAEENPQYVSTTSDMDGVLKFVADTLVVFPDWFTHVMGNLTYEKENELAFIIMYSNKCYQDGIDCMPEGLRKMFEVIKEAKENGKEVRGVAMRNDNPDLLHVTDKGVEKVDYKDVGFCMGANMLPVENEDIVIFDPIEVLNAPLSIIIQADLLDSKTIPFGHMHINDTTMLFLKTENKHERFGVFSLCEMEGEAVSVKNNILAIAKVSELKKIHPSWKQDHSTQVVIHNFDGVIEVDEESKRIEGDKELMLNSLQ